MHHLIVKRFVAILVALLVICIVVFGVIAAR